MVETMLGVFIGVILGSTVGAIIGYKVTRWLLLRDNKVKELLVHLKDSGIIK